MVFDNIWSCYASPATAVRSTWPHA